MIRRTTSCSRRQSGSSFRSRRAIAEAPRVQDGVAVKRAGAHSITKPVRCASSRSLMATIRHTSALIHFSGGFDRSHMPLLRQRDHKAAIARRPVQCLRRSTTETSDERIGTAQARQSSAKARRDERGMTSCERLASGVRGERLRPSGSAPRAASLAAASEERELACARQRSSRLRHRSARGEVRRILGDARPFSRAR
jgi:hypothetical protein